MNIACILAGGQGLRMKSGLPKQYRMLLDKPVLLWSVQTFDNCGVDHICIVADRSYHSHILHHANALCIKAPILFAQPGRERFESAYSALLSVEDLCQKGDVLLFHDAARPLIDKRIIFDNFRLASLYAGVYTAIPSQDSVFISQDGHTLQSLLPRNTLWQGQTPQSLPL